MLEALAAGLIGGSSLVFGGLIDVWRTPTERALGLIMAFGAGVLISLSHTPSCSKPTVSHAVRGSRWESRRGHLPSSRETG